MPGPARTIGSTTALATPILGIPAAPVLAATANASTAAGAGFPPLCYRGSAQTAISVAGGPRR